LTSNVCKKKIIPIIFITVIIRNCWLLTRGTQLSYKSRTYVRSERVQRLQPTWQLIRLLSSNITTGAKITVITRKLIMTSVRGTEGSKTDDVRYSASPEKFHR